MSDAIRELAGLGLVYGPFFFAVFFLVYLNQRTLRNWLAAEPGRADTCRWIYIATVASSLLLVAIAVAWWIIQMPPNRTFHGKLIGLLQTDLVWSDKLYFQEVNMPPSWASQGLGDGRIEAHRMERFLFVESRNQPFDAEDHFPVRFRGSNGQMTDVRLLYCDHPDAEYRISLDVGGVVESSMCKEARNGVTQNRAARVFPGFTQLAFAAEANVDDIVDTRAGPARGGGVKRNVLNALQAERTDIGTKSHLIGLIGEDTELTSDYLTAVTAKEPFALTVLDLSRHTDETLRRQAEGLLVGFDLARYVEELMSSQDAEKAGVARRILTAFRDSDVATLESDGVARKEFDGMGRRALVPTASPQGDRYYVEASWDPNDSDGTTTCLTNIFNEELITSRSLSEEAELMKRLDGRRFVYWYSKEWAQYMAEAIRGCGAEATYVDGTEI